MSYEDIFRLQKEQQLGQEMIIKYNRKSQWVSRLYLSTVEPVR